MKTMDAFLKPPMLLAIAYAPAPVRARLTWLLSLDQRLLEVLSRASESMIAQLRLSWWRDALKASLDKRPKGEPLLAELSALEADDALIEAGLALIDAFEVLSTDDSVEGQDTARMHRISAICGAYSFWSGCADVHRSKIEQIATYWQSSSSPLPRSLPRILRSLSILALAERLESTADVSKPASHGLRLNWHALTGR